MASLLIGVVVWMGENDTKTISVDANRFENGAKPFSFEKGLVWTGPQSSRRSYHTGEIWKRNTHRDLLDLCLRKTRAGKSRDYRDVIVFSVLKMFCVHKKTKSYHFQILPV